ncbi:hypothetical protein ACKKBG_A31635 [Auxenochlorella protothecoides x Auxenochlorella symbiontica]
MGDPSTTSPVDVDEEFGGALGLTSPPKLNPGLPTVQVDPDLLNDDLYGDLVDERGTGGTLLGLQLAQERARIKQTTDELEAQKAENSRLEEALSAVTQERDALLHNISVLYKTAKLEIARKDAEIKELRSRATPHPYSRAQSQPPAREQQHDASSSQANLVMRGAGAEAAWARNEPSSQQYSRDSRPVSECITARDSDAHRYERGRMWSSGAQDPGSRGRSAGQGRASR